MRLRTATVLLAAALAACRRAEETRPPLTAKGAAGSAAGEGSGRTLFRRLFGEPGTLNAIAQTDVPEQLVLQYVSRNLFDFDRRLEVVPGLAERLEPSADGRSFLVTLRAGSLWEDGTPVTSADAVFTLRRVADPATAAPLYKPLFEDLVSVEPVGALAFRATFSKRYAYRPMSFVLPLLPAHRYRGAAFDEAPENRAPLSNGPYRLARWKAQESIELVRNPRYAGEPGFFDRILFRILPENAVAYRALRQGDLDETWIDAEVKRRAAADPSFPACCRLLEFYDLDYDYIVLNTRLPFFADARVRRALTMLLDRQTLARTVFSGSARVVSGPWAPESPAYDPTVEPLPYDPPGAGRLLDEAGWRDTDRDGVRDRGGRAFDFELLVSSGNAIGRQVDEIFVAELARAGVRARLRSLEWASFVERLDSGSFESASLASSASDPNPDPYPILHSSQAPPHGLNSGSYRNPEADRLMERAREEPDPARRTALFHRLHRIFRDDAPAIFVVNVTKKYALRRRIAGVETSPLGLFATWPGPLAWRLDAAATAPKP